MFLHFGLSQIHHIHCQDAKIISPRPAETASQKEFTNTIAAKTINTLLRHLRIDMTNPVSAYVIRYIFTAVRIALTDETGQKNVLHLIDFTVDNLMDPNTLITLEVFHKRLVQLAASGPNAPNVLRTAAESTRKILDEPQLLAVTEGLVEGINILLEDMTDQKLRDGIGRVMKLQKWTSFLMPKVVDKIPAGLQKLRRTNSDAQISYQSIGGDREMQLQTRSWHDDEHSWINRKPKINKSRRKDRDSFDEDLGTQ